MAPAGRPNSTAFKRDRIVEMTLRLIADEGLEGATTARIAAASGVSEATLFRMFGTKQALLLAAVDRVHENFLRLMEASRKDDPLETLLELARLHTESQVSSRADHFTAPLFAFMTAPARFGLREAMDKGQLKIIEAYVELLERARTAGRISADADVRQAAWMFAAVFLVEDLSCLIGMPGFVLEGRAKIAMEQIISCISRDGARIY